MPHHPRSIVLITVWTAVLGLLLTGCASAESADADATADADSYTIALASNDEPGQPLTLFGTVVDSTNGAPLAGAQVYLYHADAEGEYDPAVASDESTARLSGEVTTGPDGQFVVHTIVPREYDQPGNRHIHLHTVQAEGYEQTGGVILFENDVNDEIRRWANETGFGTIIELTERDGIMEGHIEIGLETAVP